VNDDSWGIAEAQQIELVMLTCRSEVVCGLLKRHLQPTDRQILPDNLTHAPSNGSHTSLVLLFVGPIPTVSFKAAVQACSERMLDRKLGIWKQFAHSFGEYEGNRITINTHSIRIGCCKK